MERINKILNNSKYKDYLNRNSFCEKDRVFCKHNLEHFLDVSRIAYIMVLEGNMNISKEIIYAIGLLHDIGRWVEYEGGEKHNKASFFLCSTYKVFQHYIKNRFLIFYQLSK